MTLRIALFGSLLGFAIATACGSATTCDVSTCASGCCNSAGVCLAGDEQSACGASARQCTACAGSQVCSAHVCVTGSAADAGRLNDAGQGAATVALNEIAARGNEFVELYVIAGGDLSNYAVADSENDGGVKVSEALRFPPGTTAATGTFITILTGQSTAGPSTSCPNAVTPCFAATFGVSNSRGETVWLLGPANAVVDLRAYPANGADAGSSIGRRPNGTGTWQVNTPATPGATN